VRPVEGLETQNPEAEVNLENQIRQDEGQIADSNREHGEPAIPQPGQRRPRPSRPQDQGHHNRQGGIEQGPDHQLVMDVLRK